jgi:electron transfer flavoprotein beta subunit
LNFIVCISQVPDTESRIKIAADGRSIDEAGVKFIVSPYDEFALEEAIRLKEAKGGDVTVICYGPDRAAQALRECLARGATKAMHIKGDTAGVDSYGVALVLAAAIRKSEADLLFFGKQGVGTDNSLVPVMVAEMLDLPHVNVVTSLEVGDGTLKAHREIEGAEMVIEAPIPAVITTQKGLNEPRYASLKGIMAAKKIAIDTTTPGELGVDEGELKDKRVRWTRLELPPQKAAGRKVDGADPAAAAQEILRYIKDEVKAL